MFRFTKADAAVLFLALLLLPFGVWKLVELLLDLASHIHWS